MFDLRAVPLQAFHLPQQPAPVAGRSVEPGASRASQAETDEADPQVVDTQASTALKTTLQAALDDRQDLKALGVRLNEIASRLGRQATPQAVQNALETTPMDLGAGHSVTLATFIRRLGLFMPTSHFHLNSLADAVNERALEHPLQDFGGGLSWPLPLGQDEQRRLRQLTLDAAGTSLDQAHGNLGRSVLDVLNHQHPLPPEVLGNPVKTLEALVGSAEGQLLGKNLQEQMGGVATDRSSNDYLLAGLQLQMDPESIATPRRNQVAGFDLADPKHWGRPASAMLDGLARHLSASGKTGAQMATTGAYVLLARKAPELLIKDIPDTVSYGSPAWVSLAIAAATIEAQAPGKVPNMTFAQVMLQAESAGLADPVVTQRAQRAALVDWGVINGVLRRSGDDHYTGEQLQTLRATFIARQQQMLSAGRSLDKDIPLRKEMALAKLKERFGDLGTLFEEKLISTSGGPRGAHGNDGQRLVGHHSMLDIAMMDLPFPALFYSKDSRIPVAALNAHYRFGITEAFNRQFSDTIQEKKTAIATTIKHLIAQLPLQDRKNFEQGEITLYQHSSHTLGLGFTDKIHHPKAQELLVKLVRDGVPTAYEINFSQGSIKPTDTWRATERSSRNANVVSETKVFSPLDSHVPPRSERSAPANSSFDSFSSARSQYIADAFIEHLDLDDPGIKEQALGRTTFDEQRGRAEVVEEFLLNLVPLRSAIINFQKGNYGAGAFDLALDVFGFVTAGATHVGKLGRLGSAAISGTTKALQSAKVIGAATLNAFNPLGGLGDLAVGGTRLVGAGVSKGVDTVNKLRGASGSYDLLKAASKHHGEAATGTFNLAGQSVQGGAVLQNGRWYAFDAEKMRPYGSPLQGFTPEVKAVDGALARVRIDPGNALSNRLFAGFKLPTSTISGVSRNSQGVYVAADGHLSHIRHIDSAGETAVYEVRQVTRGEDGAVQARIYHNNRQTQLVVQHVQGDQWQRLGSKGGIPPSVEADLGPEIGRGAEGIVYESIDGKSVYKDLGPTSSASPTGYARMERDALNNYYGEGFAEVIIENGSQYIKMGKLDGVSLSTLNKGSLPPSARSLLDAALNGMEAKGVYHQDLQLKNFLYSAKDNKVYPVDIQSLPPEFVVGTVLDAYDRHKATLQSQYAGLFR